jgi:hypothetical protein
MARRLQFLDLDAVHKPLGRFKLGGEEYNVFPLSLRAVINLSQLPDAFDEADGDGLAHLQSALDVLYELVPDCPREVFDRLTIPQINALMAWANGLGEETVEKNSRPPKGRQAA